MMTKIFSIPAVEGTAEVEGLRLRLRPLPLPVV
jgi:hypothetical protein